MNKIIITGNLARDPELKTTTTGKMVCTFSVAVNRKFKNQQGVREVDFLNVVAWNQTAELCAKYLTKGRKVGVEGSVQTRSYEAQDGTKRYVVEIIASEVEFLSPKQAQPDDYAAAAAATGSTVPDDPAEIDDDELPF